MKKALKTSAIVLLAFVMLLGTALSLTACGHKHTWSEWTITATEHYRTCTECGEEERGNHDSDQKCPDCGAYFNVVAFYTHDTYIPGADGQDQAHISFVAEANEWFASRGNEYFFNYTSTNDWSKMTDEFLADYDLVMFLDTRPDDPDQRAAFQKYMENGGAWIGFHFAAFNLTPSDYNADWDWYHNEFLGTGQYSYNSWEPTAETLKIETHDHFATANLPDTIEATACEWYIWENDLRENPDITVLASIDASSFPVGTPNSDPNKAHEYWTEYKYVPVVWANNNYKMLYLNMGHNRVTYGNNSQDLSKTFENEDQNKLILDGMFGLIRN